MENLHNDLKWSPDIKAHLKKICAVLGIKCSFPVERVPHRWLSSYAAAAKIKCMIDPFRCLYCFYVDPTLAASYKSEYEVILTRHNVSDEGRKNLSKSMIHFARRI